MRAATSSRQPARGARTALPRLRPLDHHAPGPARRARRSEAGPSTPPLRHARAAPRTPTQAFKKCARVVGDVIGKYHPHGDQSRFTRRWSRLAQDFSPSAIRWSTARATSATSTATMPGGHALHRGAPDRRRPSSFSRGSTRTRSTSRPNYDGSEDEPVVLPGAFPNLLANGSSGIAVGMATSIPPHNAHELCQAALRLIEKPDTTDRGSGRAASPARTSRPAASSSRAEVLDPREPIAAAVAASACAPAGTKEESRARHLWSGGGHRDPLSGRRRAA